MTHGKGAGDPPAKHRAVNPDRLRKFIDSPSASNYRRVIPEAEQKAKTLVRSWNGDKCDVRAFHRLEHPSHVITSTDLRDVRIKTVHPSGSQLTDVAVVPPSNDPASADVITAPLMTKHDCFAHPAEIEYVPVPKAVFLREGLMTVQQRRERLLFETTYHQARDAMHKAEMKDRRLRQLVKQRYATCNVLGATEKPEKAHRVRGEPYNPDLLSHDTTRRGLSREFQMKNNQAVTRLDTQDRLFGAEQLPWSVDRAQHLRNEGNAGRPFDIVSNGTINYFPPTIPEKQHSWQTHPSVIIHPYSR